MSEKNHCPGRSRQAGSPPDLPPLPEFTLLHQDAGPSILRTTSLRGAYIQVTRQGSDGDVALLPPSQSAPPPARHPKPVRACCLQLAGAQGGAPAEEEGEGGVDLSADAPHSLCLANQEKVLVCTLSSLVDGSTLAPSFCWKEDTEASPQP